MFNAVLTLVLQNPAVLYAHCSLLVQQVSSQLAGIVFSGDLSIKNIVVFRILGLLLYREFSVCLVISRNGYVSEV